MSADQLYLLLLAGTAGISVGCAGWVLVRAAQASHRHGHREVRGAVGASPLFRMLRPVGRSLGFLVGGASAQVEMALGRPAEKSFLVSVRVWSEKHLRAAAHPEGVTADELIGFVILGGVMGGGFGALLVLRLQFGAVVPLFVAAGMYAPLFWLRGRVAHRQDDIRRGLPYALDLLTISVEAGLDFTQALARIVRKLGNTPLAIEMGQTLRDIQLGRTRAQALRELSRRVDLPELNSLVSALIQADQLGSSLGPILRVQSEQLRNRRSQRAEKRAMEAPVKILLPLIFFIMPPIFIVIFGPIVLKLI